VCLWWEYCTYAGLLFCARRGCAKAIKVGHLTRHLGGIFGIFVTRDKTSVNTVSKVNGVGCDCPTVVFKHLDIVDPDRESARFILRPVCFDFDSMPPAA